MSIWEQRGRDVVFVPPEVGGGVAVGANDWCDVLSPNSARASILSAVGNNSYKPYGFFSASRTSDGGGIGRMSLSMQDLATPGGGAWGDYVEAFIASFAHPNNTQFGVEYALVNERDTCPDVTPNQISPEGVFSGIHLGVDKPGRNGKEISSFINFLNVTGNARAVAKKGIVIAINALKMIPLLGRAFGEVMAMAKGHGFRWYDAVGNPGSTIICNVDNAAYAPHVEFTNGAIHYLDARGVAQFSFNTETGVPYFGNTAWSPVPPVGAPIGRMSFYVGGRPVCIPVYQP